MYKTKTVRSEEELCALCGELDCNCPDPCHDCPRHCCCCPPCEHDPSNAEQYEDQTE